MAQISFNLEGTVDISKFDECNPVMQIGLHTEMTNSLGENWTYSKDIVWLHGNSDQIRSFADKILAALPVKQEVAA